MNIAIACDDETTLAAHFGRCAGFAIFEIVDGSARPMAFRPHLGHHHAHEVDEHSHHHHAHATDHHGSFIDLLGDCRVIIYRGMGKRAIADLQARGIAPCIVGEDLSPREAAQRYAQGRLQGSSESTCGSH